MNDRIRSPQVRLVGPDGDQIGIVTTQDALRRARDLDLDLVEVAPQAQPPVCRIMDYGKYKYERDIRQKEARKKQSRIEVKEIKFRPKIDPHDYATKKGHVVRFLNAGARVKVTIMFRGREMAHTELGRKILDRLVEDLKDLATVDSYPKLDGRNMVMVIAPIKRQVHHDQPKSRPEPDEAPRASGADGDSPDAPAAPESASPAPESPEETAAATGS
ncbi:MAG TPA: translation initiation factor IF-3 [Actinomycetota bacterium]